MVFVVGIFLGFIVFMWGKDDLKEMCNSVDDDGVYFVVERGLKLECIFLE